MLRNSTSVVRVLVALSVCAPAYAAVTVLDVRPANPTVVNTSTVDVSAAVSSDFAIQSVTAQFGSVSGSLVSRGNGRWGAPLSLSALSKGTFTVVVTATDINGAVGTGQAQVSYDLLPTLSVVAPLEWSVARPSVAVKASCSDDDAAGCSRLEVAYAPTRTEPPARVLLATGVSSVDQVVSLSAFRPGPAFIAFTAIDSRGQRTESLVAIELEPSPVLTETLTLDGRILDLDEGRVLLLDFDGARIKIYDRQSQQYTVIATRSDLAGLRPSRLTPLGALIAIDYGANPPFCSLYEWRAGQLNLLDNIQECTSLAVAGRYAIWKKNQGLTFRDLQTSMNVTATADAAGASVAPNGDVVFGAGGDYQIRRWSGGMTTQLTADSYRNLSPLTDGIHVIYKRLQAGGTAPASLMLATADGGVALDMNGGALPVSPGRTYQLAGGWIAFVDVWGGARQVFARDPQGTATRLTSFGPPVLLGTDAVIDAMSSGGEVMVVRGERRYLTAPNRAPCKVSAGSGESWWMGDAWHLSLGRSLFRVNAGDGGSCWDENADGGGVTPFDAGMPIPSDAGMQPDSGVEPPDAGEDEDAGVSAPPPPGPGCAGCEAAPAGDLLLLLLLTLRLRRRARR